MASGRTGGKRPVAPETALPGEFDAEPEGIALFLFFRFLTLVPLWVWVLGALAMAFAWVLVAPWAAGVVLGCLVAGVAAWSIQRVYRQRKVE